MGRIFQKCEKCLILIDENDSLNPVQVGESIINVCQKCKGIIESNCNESKLLLETV